MSEKNEAKADAKVDVAKELEKLKAENAALQQERNEALAKAAQLEAVAKEKSAQLEEQVARQEERIARQIAQQRKVRIVIPSGRDAHERCPVPVGLNGREFLIERDKEVDVPQGVLDVLNLAVATVAHIRGDGDFVNTDFHKAPRFPVRVIGYVDPKTGELEK